MNRSRRSWWMGREVLREAAPSPHPARPRDSGSVRPPRARRVGHWAWRAPELEEETVLLLVQGRVKPESEDAYQRYAQAAKALLGKYRGELLASGGGIGSDLTDASWQINEVIRFPSLRKAEGFLADPLLKKAREKYGTPALLEYQTSLIASP